MTITTTASKVVCLGNGSTTAFAYSFLIPLATEVVVTYTDANGNSTVLGPSQYNASAFGNPAGGTITYPTSGSPIATGTTLTIQRVLPLTQNTSVSNQGAFYPNVVETALDTATMQIQQLSTAINNSLQTPVTDQSAPPPIPAAAARANKLLGFDGSGNPIAASSVTDINSATTAANNAATSANSAAANANTAAATANTAATAAGSAIVDASTTSLTIGTGAQTLTISAGKQFVVGQRLRISDSTSNWMEGQVSSYTGTTLVLQVDLVGGSGTFATWTVGVAGAQGQTGPAGGAMAVSGATVVNNIAIWNATNGSSIKDGGVPISSLAPLASPPFSGQPTAPTVALTGVISPAALSSGNTNNYAPAGLSAATMLRLTANGSGSTLTGLAAQPAGTVLIISNVGGGPLVLAGQNANSTAANRFLNNAPVIVLPGQSTALQYDGTGNGWQIGQAQTAAPPAAARKNLKIVTTSITSSTITADELVLEDPNGATYRAPGGVNVSYATGTSGAGGLDTGTIAASNMYFEYVIYNPATNIQTAIISLSAAAPTMPPGYTFKARVGSSYFDAGSKLRFKVQNDCDVQIVLGTNPLTTPIITSGAQGSYGGGSSPTLVSVSLANFVPSTAARAFLGVTCNWKGATQANVLWAPSTAYGGTNNGPQGSNGQLWPWWFGAATSSRIEPVLEALSFGFASDAAGGAVALLGYKDNL